MVELYLEFFHELSEKLKEGFLIEILSKQFSEVDDDDFRRKDVVQLQKP